MSSIVNITPMYTWQTAKGELSLYQTGKEYSLQLMTKGHQIFEISKQNIHGSFFDTQPEKISEICKRHLPVIKTKENIASPFSVTFHPFTFPSDQQTEDCDQKGPVSKKMEFGFNFNKLESAFSVQFSSEAPSYRSVVRGLNFEGKCQVETCEAHKKNVIVPLGIGEFNVPKEMSQSVCPACDTALNFEKITNLGFWDCTYTIEGKQNDAKSISKKDTAPSDKYKTFKPGENCTWNFLEVKTELIKKS